MDSFPRVTFGIIVMNGEPFTRYCLRALYPYAYEIIVVEGGHEDTKAVATPDGHSVDGTLKVLMQFKQEEDPEDKVKIVTRHGFWPKRDELGRCRTAQSRAYAERATGDYLWQVDIDEFYLPEHMEAILSLLREVPSITAVSFRTRTFWGSPAYVADSWALRRGSDIYHRLFKWGAGYQYVTHEPPTVHDEHGRDLRTIHWVTGQDLARQNIYMYHYSLLFPWQVRQKTLIYHDEKPELCAEIVNWAEHNFFQLGSPYRVHNLYRYPSWLERFSGKHPPEVAHLMDDIRVGRVTMDLRRTADIESLLSSWWYPLGRWGLKIWEPVDRVTQRCRQYLGRVKRRLVRHSETSDTKRE